MQQRRSNCTDYRYRLALRVRANAHRGETLEGEGESGKGARSSRRSRPGSDESLTAVTLSSAPSRTGSLDGQRLSVHHPDHLARDVADLPEARDTYAGATFTGCQAALSVGSVQSRLPARAERDLYERDRHRSGRHDVRL